MEIYVDIYVECRLCSRPDSVAPLPCVTRSTISSTDANCSQWLHPGLRNIYTEVGGNKLLPSTEP